jgi:TRAP-type C4-dicarboxylate transport system substrate-binding protein
MLKLCIGASFALLLSSVMPAMSETKLSYGSWAPDTYPNSTAARAFFDRVTEATNGAITFEGHWGGTVVNIRTSLPGVKDRLVDAAYVTGSLFAQQAPIDIFVTDHAMITAEPRVFTAAINETLLLGCPECADEWRGNGVVSLTYVADAPFYIQCQAEPTSLAYFAGKQVRSVGPFGHLASTMGATPVNTAPGEVYEAMQRGAVACAIGGGFWQRAYSLWDVAKYVIDHSLGQYNNGSIMTINRDLWRELGEDGRKAFLDNRAFLVATAVRTHVEDDRAARAGGAEHGVNWIAPPQDIVEHIEKVRAADVARVVKAGEDRGVAIAARVTKDLQDNIVKWTGIVAGLGDDWAKYEEALQREIFSKTEPQL